MSTSRVFLQLLSTIHTYTQTDSQVSLNQELISSARLVGDHTNRGSLVSASLRLVS